MTNAHVAKLDEARTDLLIFVDELLLNQSININNQHLLAHVESALALIKSVQENMVENA
tara:strand:+ start:5365 stop:5541 length:177 start_codon:yes stop_codon:yes gene_type:complete